MKTEKMTVGRRMVQAALAIRRARLEAGCTEPKPYWSPRQERAQQAKHDPWGEGR